MMVKARVAVRVRVVIASVIVIVMVRVMVRVTVIVMVVVRVIDGDGVASQLTRGRFNRAPSGCGGLGLRAAPLVRVVTGLGLA